MDELAAEATRISGFLERRGFKFGRYFHSPEAGELSLTPSNDEGYLKKLRAAMNSAINPRKFAYRLRVNDNELRIAVEPLKPGAELRRISSELNRHNVAHLVLEDRLFVPVNPESFFDELADEVVKPINFNWPKKFKTVNEEWKEDLWNLIDKARETPFGHSITPVHEKELKTGKRGVKKGKEYSLSRFKGFDIRLE